VVPSSGAAVLSRGGTELGNGAAELRGGSADLCDRVRTSATGGDERSGEIRDVAGHRVPQRRPQRHEIPEFGDADPVSARTALYESIQN
jgi:hypothetical protein